MAEDLLTKILRDKEQGASLKQIRELYPNVRDDVIETIYSWEIEVDQNFNKILEKLNSLGFDEDKILSVIGKKLAEVKQDQQVIRNHQQELQNKFDTKDIRQVLRSREMAEETIKLCEEHKEEVGTEKKEELKRKIKEKIEYIKDIDRWLGKNREPIERLGFKIPQKFSYETKKGILDKFF